VIRRVILVASLLIASTALSLSFVTPEWQTKVEQNEPELADILYSGLRALPDISRFDGSTRKAYLKSRDDALSSFRGSLDKKRTEVISNRIAAAYAAKPPEWEVVYLGFSAAYYAPPIPNVLKIAEKTVRTPPSVPCVESLVIAAMRLLVASGQRQLLQIVCDCVDDVGYLEKDQDEFDVGFVGGAAVDCLAELAPVDAKSYLTRLSSRFPYVPEVSPHATTPADKIATHIQVALQSMNESELESIISLGNTRP